MPEKEVIDQGTEPWNVAKGYVTLKILTKLVECDKLISIAIYGAEQIDDSLQIPEQLKDIARIEAIKRLVDVLKTIIENSYFALKSKDKEKVNDLKDRIKEIDEVLDGISNNVIDQGTNIKSIKVNQEHFFNVLNELRDIKTELNIPLNNSNLIFPAHEEFDLDKIKEELIFGG